MENKSQENSERASAISIIFIFFILASIYFAAINGKMKEINDASFESAKAAVTLSIGLIGIMSLWLGLMRILEAAGLMYSLANGLKPIMSKLFPEVPVSHPAMGSMILNFSANMLGLGNAATPFGIKAMKELDKLNPNKGTATNAMCLFLAINTSSIALLPLGVISVRAAAGAANPTDIWIPATLATLCSTFVGITTAIFFAKKDKSHREILESSDTESEELKIEDYKTFRKTPSLIESWIFLISIFTFVICFLWTFFYQGVALREASHWLMPGLMMMIVSFGVSRGVKIYEAVTDGAKQGFDIAVRIIPFLVVILVAIGMFRASGGMEFAAKILNPITGLIWMPADVLPMALVRPLSGTGSFAVMSEIINHDPNSYSSFLASIIMGSTETTFYILAVYFGAIGVTKLRHAFIASILADLTGIFASCILTKLFY